jgi:beta-glucosidase
MPEANYYGRPLIEAVKKGLVDEETINNSVRRILRAKFWAGLFDRQSTVDLAVVGSKEHIELAREAARKSIVLLKNENDLLPLDRKRIKTIAVLGPQANMTVAGVGLGSSQVTPSYTITPLEGIKDKVGDKIKITDKPEEAEVAIVFVGLTEGIAGRIEGEGTDRSFLHLPGFQDRLIKEVSHANKNTIVVLIGGSAITMNKWIDDVPAILEAWYPGQEGGIAIAEVLFGDYNPGGKLPITFPKSIKQLPPFDWNYKGEYKQGIGYRYYDKQKIEPLFPFGYGLSYTEFRYSDLEVPSIINIDETVNISLKVTNIGKRKGDEVVQLYLQDIKSSIERPIKELKGFKRVTLEAGETKKVSFKLKPEDLAFYNKDMKFIVEPGIFKVMIGSSSRDIRLVGSFKVTDLKLVRDLKGVGWHE